MNSGYRKAIDNIANTKVYKVLSQNFLKELYCGKENNIQIYFYFSQLAFNNDSRYHSE